MKVWLVRDLEPTPLDDGHPRLLRAGMLSEALARKGHETIWFTSSFDHYSRKQRIAGRFDVPPNLKIDVLQGAGYQENISLKRLLHNFNFGRNFLRVARKEKELPDVIIADLPTTEAAAAAVHFGRATDIPTIVNIRDLWPDFFAEFAPSPLRPVIRLATIPLNRQAKFACRHATSLVGISEGYLRWGQTKGKRNSRLDRIFHLGYPRAQIQYESQHKKAFSKFNIPESAEVVSFIGSWGASYDMSLILESARLLQQRENLIIAVAGDWSARPRMAEAFMQLPNVRLLGWLDKHDISCLLARSAVGLLPYVEKAPQGLPNKIFEYMAHGLFQIATLSGEAKMLLESTGTGIYCRSGVPFEFASAIQRAIGCESSDEKRDRRRQIFEQKFESTRIYDSLIRHIEDVVNEYGRHSDSSRCITPQE